MKTVSAFYAEVYKKLGEKASTNAQTLAAASKGKRIRSYNDAIAAWNKYGNNIEKKLSLADRNAIVTALNSMTQADLAKNYQKFAKAFGVTAKALDLHRLYQNIKMAVKTGNWAPVITNIESLLAGALVAELTAIIFGGLVIGPVTAVMFVVLGMLLASYVDDNHMKSLNEWFTKK
ncbi:colicin-like pore-forming protein [Erwinia sp. E_sp_W01_6]